VSLSFAHPWGLLALLAVPVVIVLHLLRRRQPERPVAALFLFRGVARAAEGGRSWAPLRRSASLFLECAAALLLALALSGPRLSEAVPPAHLVVVLDATASMGAAGVPERAREVALSRLDDLPSDAQVTLLATGRRPDVLLGPRAPAAAARAALDAWGAKRPSADPAPALDLGLDLAAPGDVLLYVTDREEPTTPAAYEVRAVGEARPNAAVASVRRVASGEEETVYVDLAAWGSGPVATEVVVEVGRDARRREVARAPVRLEPGKTTRWSVAVPKSDLDVRVRLAPDALAIDDEVVVPPEPRRPVAFASTLGEATDAGLGLDRIARAVPDLARVEDAGQADLVFARDGSEVATSAVHVVVATPGTERDAWIGPFLVERRHAVVRGLTLQGVVWTAGRGPLPGRALVSAGEQALLAEEETPLGVRYWWNLDTARTNLASTPDGPILLANLVEAVRARRPGPTSATVPLDGVIEFRHAGPAEAVATWRFETPSGRQEAVHGWRSFTWEPDEPGLHRLLDGEREIASWSVPFDDARESDLTGGATLVRPATGSAGGRGRAVEGPGEGIARALLFLLLLVVAADWWVLARGRRPAPRAVE
jgi:hypothetical protein